MPASDAVGGRRPPLRTGPLAAGRYTGLAFACFTALGLPGLLPSATFGKESPIVGRSFFVVLVVVSAWLSWRGFRSGSVKAEDSRFVVHDLLRTRTLAYADVSAVSWSERRVGALGYRRRVLAFDLVRGGRVILEPCNCPVRGKRADVVPAIAARLNNSLRCAKGDTSHT